jgi:hypothetical protein
MIFTIKMDFIRKARLVAGGHTTKPPESLTYASVVSRDSTTRILNCKTERPGNGHD